MARHGALAAALLFATHAGAAPRGDAALDWTLCRNDDENLPPDVVIARCTSVLRTAFYNRGNAHHERGELDRAIADFDTALELDPSYALAYGTRARSYFAKGDIDRALADTTLAVRL